MADTIKVRTVFTPWKETVLEGGERERAELESRGLLYKGNATTDEGAAKAVEKQQTSGQQTGDKPAG